MKVSKLKDLCVEIGAFPNCFFYLNALALELQAILDPVTINYFWLAAKFSDIKSDELEEECRDDLETDPIFILFILEADFVFMLLIYLLI